MLQACPPGHAVRTAFRPRHVSNPSQPAAPAPTSGVGDAVRRRGAYDRPMDHGSNPWRQLARRTAYRNPWLTVWEDDVIRPDGQLGIYGVVHFVHRAVGVVPLDEAGRVLLVGQWRYTLGAWSWEIPEGGARPEEDPLEAARRELAEETGYTARSWGELVRAHLSNSVTDEDSIVWLARGLEPGVPSPEGTEQIELRWVDFDEALAMCHVGRITDALTILGMQRLALDGRRTAR